MDPPVNCPRRARRGKRPPPQQIRHHQDGNQDRHDSRCGRKFSESFRPQNESPKRKSADTKKDSGGPYRREHTVETRRFICVLEPADAERKIFYADPTKSNKAPDDQGMKYSGGRPVAHDAGLQYNFGKCSPEPLPERSRRKFPWPGKMREEPLI